MGLRLIWALAALVAVLCVCAVGGASAHTSTASVGNVNWLSWGNTLDENRYSSLTNIDGPYSPKVGYDRAVGAQFQYRQDLHLGKDKGGKRQAPAGQYLATTGLPQLRR